ncbi:MAG: response regulator [Verrucomicrobiales bacterium]|nr:response regulator [Verrucomicrobiales bacterium]
MSDAPASPAAEPGTTPVEVTPQVVEAFTEHERTRGIRRLIVGCYLVMILLPLGSIVDVFLFGWHEHGDLIAQFAWLRLICALSVLPLLLLFRSRVAGKYYRSLGILLAVIPGLAMVLIIHQTPPALHGGAASPYYAGINLILLAMAMLAQWTWRQSLGALVILMGLYFAATWSTVQFTPPGVEPRGNFGVFFNNLWFMLLTGVIMIVGSEIQGHLRFRDFVSNWELQRSRKELEASYRRLQELDELKGRFFANISHELRTPLTLLLTPLEPLLAEEALPDPRLRDTLATMRANGMRLLKLINDLLDLVRLDAGQLQLQRATLEVEVFLGGLINAVRALAEERGLRLRCEVDPALSTVPADPDKLEKVFLNLLFNAIKFTAAGGTIRLTARREGDRAVFQVIDTGVGIATEHQRFLFSRFWQADSSSQRKYQGAGIGLALVKELVLAHGGTVSAQSEPGRGTTMSVRLPLEVPADAGSGTAPEKAPPPSVATVPALASPAAAPASPAGTTTETTWLRDLYRRAEMFPPVPGLRETLRSPGPTGSGKAPRVLIVDDEPDMLRFLHTQLCRDYQVIEAVDGDQAVTLAAQYLPDVIICDLMLPEKDGLAVCRELRNKTVTRALPFLMLTARADDETKLRALQHGANDFLSKPFSLAELRARVRSLSQSHQLQLALSRQNQKLEATLEELKETELQLVQAEKMASLGRMSAGIIHEINNPLNFSLTALGVLERMLVHLSDEDRADAEEMLRDIREGLRRVAGIIGDLRTFTHPQGGELEEVDVQRAVEAALRFLAAEWRDRVTVETHIPEEFTVPAIHNKLIQVFVNLLQNSLDALRSHPPADGPPCITISAVEREGARVVLVRDNGPGIPAHQQARIFDPFFTTKEVGQGTGLGLSICYRLLNEVGGGISVRSQEGEFCEFSLAFADRPRERVVRTRKTTAPEKATALVA